MSILGILKELSSLIFLNFEIGTMNYFDLKTFETLALHNVLPKQTEINQQDFHSLKHCACIHIHRNTQSDGCMLGQDVTG